MIKCLLLSTALVAGTVAFAPASMAEPMTPAHHARMRHHARHRVTASGRCGGTSYGTGQRGCGTATGGTPGGNPSRN